MLEKGLSDFRVSPSAVLCYTKFPNFVLQTMHRIIFGMLQKCFCNNEDHIDYADVT